MRTLILVGSSILPPYDAFMQTQKETWSSLGFPNTETIFYYAGDKNTWISEDTLSVQCDNGFFWAHWRFKLALDYLWEKDWDIIFRPHSSSYVNKKLLVEISNTLPKEGLYAGWQLGGYPELPYIVWEGKQIKQECCSGAGFFISRDYADILRKELPNKRSIEDDVLIGRTLQLHGISVTHDLKLNDATRRLDIRNIHDFNPRFHYRFNTGGDRQQDMLNMCMVHNIIMNK